MDEYLKASSLDNILSLSKITILKHSIFLILFYVAISATARAQSNFSVVDKFNLDGYSINVIFKDPFKKLIEKYPDFDSKDNKTKNDLLSYALHNDTLYIFQLIKNGNLLKSYALIGNPEKAKMPAYFNLHVQNSNREIEKNIDKVNIRGAFFEHMSIFQTEKGKEVVGKIIQIWGYYVPIEPYKKLKSAVVELIKMDLTNNISSDLLYKKIEPIEPLYDYQKWALANVRKRTITTTVFAYDSLGQVKNKYPRTEIDTAIYLASTSKQIGDVTNFPIFSVKDTTIVNGNRTQIKSTLENIKHYLKDIEVVFDPGTKQAQNIHGKLIIHGYTAKGHSTYDELYLAEFSTVGKYALPTTVKYTALDDKKFALPRIVIKIEYELK
ncbi:hypothetical protein [Mucilaginibacter sp.]|uniref:hypothetical protein n=1 Tax=Mucilaginibacter sp. TaxID=1882438 RepID=UPI0026165E55|nr:hypothetical protein [Mucilaginibacter sp.]